MVKVPFVDQSTFKQKLTKLSNNSNSIFETLMEKVPTVDQSTLKTSYMTNEETAVIY
jgi:hypothetical protein